MEQYVRLTLEEDKRGMFVRKKDFEKLQKAIKKQNPKEIASCAFETFANSPDGASELSKRIFTAMQILKMPVGQLEPLRSLINHRIKVLKKKGGGNSSQA